MPFTTYWDNATLDNHFGKAAYAVPANIYVGLSTADPTKDGSGIAEPSGGGYARVSTAAADWNAAAAGVLDNANAVTFPAPSGSWGSPAYFTLHDAAAAGNLLAYGALETVQAVGLGSTAPSFAAGDLIVRGSTT